MLNGFDAKGAGTHGLEGHHLTICKQILLANDGVSRAICQTVEMYTKISISSNYRRHLTVLCAVCCCLPDPCGVQRQAEGQDG
jgi:hypothetical protein